MLLVQLAFMILLELVLLGNIGVRHGCLIKRAKRNGSRCSFNGG